MLFESYMPYTTKKEPRKTNTLGRGKRDGTIKVKDVAPLVKNLTTDRPGADYD